ncbi:MAG: anthranilate phosphoribosyltransferase [Planctomycetota bacterium]
MNISTAAAIVAAASGVRVVKHGSRAATSKSGSADVLEELGLELVGDPDGLKRCLDQAEICFAFAHNHHPAMKYVAPVRKALGVLTIFNLLGPLTNPAGSKHQLMGVTTPGRTSFMVGVLQRLGSERAWVVCSDDGLDELATWCPSTIGVLRDGQIDEIRLDPEQFGFKNASPDAMRIDHPAASADVIRRVFDGEEGPARDIVLLNAAAGLVVAGGADDVAAGLDVARHAIDSGRAGETLEKLVAASKG